MVNKAIGEKIKFLRSEKKMTLKDLADASGLSTGFLSQLERGMSSVAVDTLEKIARYLDVDLTFFFDRPRERDTYVQRHFERSVFQIENNNFIHYHLTTIAEHSDMLPRLIELLPGQFDEPIDEYAHAGEEFVYVLEGVLTLFINHERKDLYPGDIAHYPSTIEHNWANYTNKIVKILIVSSHNPFNTVKGE
ncbi:MAG: helix-turn-helix transcriptional regulator [Clostridia bacterium]|nr:helix-turn-helix transcriptional regulator [Clostridia bacterium]